MRGDPLEWGGSVGVGGCERGSIGVSGCERGSIGVGGCERGSVGVGGCERGSIGVGGCERGSIGVGGCVRGSIGVGDCERGSIGVGGSWDLTLTSASGEKNSTPRPHVQQIHSTTTCKSQRLYSNYHLAIHFKCVSVTLYTHCLPCSSLSLHTMLLFLPVSPDSNLQFSGFTNERTFCIAA